MERARMFTSKSQRYWAICVPLLFAFPALSNTLPTPGFLNFESVCLTEDCPILAQSSGPVSYTGSTSIGNVLLTASGTADAAVGVLRAFATATLSAPDTSEDFRGFDSFASFTDTVTINFAPFTGSVGYLIPIFTLTGGADSGGMGVVQVFWDDSVGNGGVHRQELDRRGNATLQFNPITFHYGSPFLLEARLGANALGIAFRGTQVTGTADFGHTAILTGLEVFDTNMNPVQGETFDSALGGTYSSTGVVPEPSSLWIVTTALLILGVAYLRKRHCLRAPAGSEPD